MNAPSPTEESYSRRLWHRFKSDLFARCGLGIIIFLFIVAALAPFIANSHALVRIADGKTTFPVLRSMEPIEWRFLAYVALAGFGFLLTKIHGNRPWKMGSYQIRHATLVAILAVLTVLSVECRLHNFRPFNDPTNDRERPATWKLLAPIPWSPIESSPDSFSPPTARHLCGTDSTGRDIASRILHGARTSLSIGFIAQSIALTVGIAFGGFAGYYRGWTDIAVCRFIEVLDCFPPLLLILVVTSVLESKNNMFYIMAVIGLTSWTGVARLVRGEFLRLSAQPFTQAAQALGAGDFRIVVRHLLPNSLGPILVAGTFGVASAILIESSLSFLGFGMQAPTPSWGEILSDARRYIDFAWWLAFFPGLAILVTLMSYNFVGEGLRDAVDPRLKVK